MGTVFTCALAACPHHTTVDAPVARPAEGIAIAIYQPPGKPPFAVVDDRRTLEVTGDTVSLDRIDPAGALPSLVIEPLDGARFKVETCVRDRIDASAAALDQLAQSRARPDVTAPTDPRNQAPPLGVLSPLVRCRVAAAPGKHFVRVLHVAPTIAFRAFHAIKLDGERAQVASRFSLATPAWKSRADVVLYEGLPGTGDPPKPLARGVVALDGATAILTNPARSVPARLRRIYDGAVRERDQLPIDPGWGRESRRAVFVVLELDDTQLPIGVLEVHAGLPDEPVRDVMVSEPDRELVGTTLRVPLWIDDTLHGVRRNDVDTFPGPRGRVIQQRLQLSVSSTADTARDVWIEERLRPLKRDVRGTPAKPVIEGDIARTKLTVPPHGTERVSYTIHYDL